MSTSTAVPVSLECATVSDVVPCSGGKTSLPDSKKMLPIHYAMQRQHTECIQLLQVCYIWCVALTYAGWWVCMCVGGYACCVCVCAGMHAHISMCVCELACGCEMWYDACVCVSPCLRQTE